MTEKIETHAQRVVDQDHHYAIARRQVADADQLPVADEIFERQGLRVQIPQEAA